MNSHHQSNVDRFNTMASQWDQDASHVRMAQKVARAIVQALQPEGAEDTLEFGAGTGLATLIVAPRVKQLTALDGSAGMLEVLRQKCARKGLTNVRAMEGDVTDVPLAQYDLIYSAMTLHHVQDVPALLARLAAHTRPGGRIALADLDREDGSFHGDEVKGVAHLGFERDGFGAWLQEAGFADVRFSTAWTVERPREDGGTARYPIFLAVARKPGGAQ